MRAMNQGWSRLLLGVVVLGLALLGLGCKDLVEAPTSLVYATNPASHVVGVTITPNKPTASGGAIDSYAVSPSLPTGLSLDTKTGIISGTPTVITATASYTVTATNVTGSTTASLSITITDLAPSDLTYSVNPAVYTQGTAIPANSPTSAGGAVLSYSVSPTLPLGLSLDTATGVISGTPTAVTATASYTVTATNSGGSTSASLSITVNGPALTITTQPASQSILVGQTALFSVTAAGTGTLSYQWLKGGVAIAGATSSSYTTPAAVLADDGSSFNVQVSDAFGGTVTSNAAVLTVAVIASGPGTAIATGSLVAARAFHTATLLGTGDALITGGKNASSSLQSTELYDTAAGTFSARGSLSVPRYNHTATLLADGRVLLIGGVSFATTLASAELYDPATGLFTATGSLLAARSDHTATLLGNGKVLVVGGRDLTAYPATAELWDPATGVFTATTGAPISPRATHTASLLASGKVLLAGGYRASALATAELYDPTAGTFAATGGLNVARAYQTATTLANGKVLVVGGAATGLAELYDPTAGTFATTGSLLIARASWHVAALLPSGRVLIAGGLGTGTPAVLLSEAELFDPATGLFTATGSLTTGREAHTATVLATGKVLLVGGAGAGYLSSAELYY